MAVRNPAAFHRWMLPVYFLCSHTVGWGTKLGFHTLHFSGGSPQPLKYLSGTLAAIHGSPASPFMSALHSLPVILWWSCFFCLSMVIRLLSHYCSVVYSGWFLPNLVIIPDWSWREVCVTPTYSSTILNLFFNEVFKNWDTAPALKDTLYVFICVYVFTCVFTYGICI